MPKNDNNGTGKFEKRGYRPLNVGYSAEEKRGYSPKAQGANLPKPPRGGTGESSNPANPVTAEGGKK